MSALESITLALWSLQVSNQSDVEVSLFRNVWSRTPIAKTWTWDTLVDALTRPRIRPKDKKDLPLWSPNFYHEGALRGNAGVASMSCLVLDYDDNADIERDWAVWERYRSLLHVTYKHTSDTHRFRIVLPFRTPILPENWLAVWRWAELQTHKTIDRSCKDLARFYYLSCMTENHADYLFKQRDGVVLDLSHLKYCPPVRRRFPIVCGKLNERNAEWRLLQAANVGGVVAGNSVRGILCPSCSRPGVWYTVDPAGTSGLASCKHKNSCGWFGKISSLTR